MEQTIKTNLAKKLLSLQQHIRDLCLKYQRDPSEIKLLAVSKSQSTAKIDEAITAGQLAFGENYLQEALDKIAYFTKNQTALEWHFIGQIQSNKTALIAKHFSWVHTVDRFKIAERLSHQRPSHLAPLNICLQINLDNEAQKAGLPLADLEELVKKIRDLPQLKLQGLMAIPKPKDDFQAQRNDVRCLREWVDKLGLNTLSMGMSEDYEAAIAEGTTIIRLGRAIFGERSI